MQQQPHLLLSYCPVCVAEQNFSGFKKVTAVNVYCAYHDLCSLCSMAALRRHVETLAYC
jgi:hypothetical protein